MAAAPVKAFFAAAAKWWGAASTLTKVVTVASVISTAYSVYSSVAQMRQLKGVRKGHAGASTDSGRDVTTRGTIDTQKLVYGQAKISGPISYLHAEEGVMYMQVVLARGEIEAVKDVYFDDVKIADASISSTGAVTAGEFAADADGNTIAYIKRYTGTSDQVADQNFTTLSDYTADHRGRGLSYLSVKLQLTEKSQETWDKYGAPNNLSALVEGKKDVYDPRLDSNYLTNPDTTNASYQTYAAGTNPPLAIANYLMDTSIGLGVQASEIDWATFHAAATYCDVMVAEPGSTTAKRFTCNGVLFSSDSHKTNLDKLTSACNGTLVYACGKYFMEVGYTAPVASFNDDSLTAPVQISTAFSRDDRFNTIKATYHSEDHQYERQEMPAATISSARTRDNNEVLEREIHLGMTTRSYESQRIANRLIQKTDEQKVVKLSLNYSALNVRPGDRINLTLTELGWSNLVFRVSQWTYNENGVELVAREDDSASYSDPAAS